MRFGRAFAVIAALALLPTIPFIVFGYAGHDYRLHLTSWMELRQAWLQGNFAPGWAALANYDLGGPRFSFYPPFSFWAGAALSLLLPFRLAPGAFVWLAFLLSGLSMYAASYLFVAPEDRLKAAILYMATPYFLLTAINRFAAGELLVQAVLPLMVLYFYRAVWHAELRAVMTLGCLFGLSWLSDIPASIVLAYSFLFVALLIGARRRSPLPVLHYIASESISVVLAAFYLLPILFEQKWVNPTAIFRIDFRNNFIFIPPSRLPIRGFGLCCWLFACVEIALIAACAYVTQKRKDRIDSNRVLVELAAVAFLFQLPITTFLWRILPKFRYIGFPFRFLAVISAVLPLMVFARNVPTWLRRSAYALVGLMAILPFWGYPRPHFELNPRPYPKFSQRMEEFSRGYQGMPEYLPAGAKRQYAPVTLAPVSIDRSSGSACSVALLSKAPRHWRFSSISRGPCMARVATYFYPYWKAVDETGESLPTGKDANGILLVSLPAGDHRIQLDFRAVSTVRTIGNATSFLMVLLLALALFLGTHSSLLGRRFRAAVFTGNISP